MPLFPEIVDITRVDQLAGDGSTRSYYRVFTKRKTFVLQTNGTDALNYRRFIEAHKFYLKMGIPVSRILAHDDVTLWVLLEDLGSQDLQALPSIKNLTYSVRLLNKLVTQDVEVAFSKSWLSERSLDEARFIFEMNYFVEHFVNKLIGESLSTDVVKELHNLAKQAASGPKVFCHRDYQSRNLMKASQGDEFLMIDFQDSQWGPMLYDAVSLCWDPYFVVSDSQRESLFSEYLASLDSSRLSDSVSQMLSNSKTLEQHKQFLIAERFIKAIGSFASFKTTRGKDTHLVYVKDSFETVAKALAKLSSLGVAYPLLTAKVQDWMAVSDSKGWRR